MIRYLFLALVFASTVEAQDWTTGPFNPTPQTRLVSVRSEVASHSERRQQLQRNEDNTFWKFAPESPHQSAAVRVSCFSGKVDEQGRPMNNGGSGTLVGTTGNITLVVTNHHVVETQSGQCSPTIDVYLRDGRKFIGHHMLATPREDVAVYRIDQTGLPTVAVSSENAPEGEMIEVMGFGGPLHHKNAFRPYIARTVPTNLALAIDAPAISGDSGSGMIWKHVLVGVNWGADSHPHQTAGVSGDDGVPLVYPATSSADANFLNRFLTQACGPSGCQPIIGRPGYLIPRGDQQWGRQPQQPQGGQQFPGPEQFYRPEGGGQSQPEQPQQGGLTPPQEDNSPKPSTPPVQSSPLPSCDCNGGCDCDPDALADAIIKRMGGGPVLKGPDNTPCPPGPQGEKGERGEQGPAGPPGPPGTVGREHLEEIIAAIKADPDMRGPQGEQGPEGKQGPKGDRGPEGPGIAKMRLIDNGDVVVTFGNGREEIIGNLSRPASNPLGQADSGSTGERSPAYFQIVPKGSK